MGPELDAFITDAGVNAGAVSSDTAIQWSLPPLSGSELVRYYGQTSRRVSLVGLLGRCAAEDRQALWLPQFDDGGLSLRRFPDDNELAATQPGGQEFSLADGLTPRVPLERPCVAAGDGRTLTLFETNAGLRAWEALVDEDSPPAVRHLDLGIDTSTANSVAARTTGGWVVAFEAWQGSRPMNTRVKALFVSDDGIVSEGLDVDDDSTAQGAAPVLSAQRDGMVALAWVRTTDHISVGYRLLTPTVMREPDAGVDAGADAGADGGEPPTTTGPDGGPSAGEPPMLTFSSCGCAADAGLALVALSLLALGRRRQAKSTRSHASFPS